MKNIKTFTQLNEASKKFNSGFIDGDVVSDEQRDSSRYLEVTNGGKTFIVGDNGERRQVIYSGGDMKFVPPINRPGLKGNLSLAELTSRKVPSSKREKKELNEADAPKKYWMGSVPEKDDLGDKITDEFIDGKTNQGPWATMTPKSFKQYGTGLGTGRGQKYKKQEDGKWLKVEG